MQALKGVSENLSQLKRSPLNLLLTPILSMLIAINLIAPQLRFPPIKFKETQNPKTQQFFFNIIIYKKSTYFQGNIKNLGLNFCL